MNENNFADLNKKFSIRILRSSPALPDFRAGALPARIFFAPLKARPGHRQRPLGLFTGRACNIGLE
jgi:hypothetical protein